MSADCLFCRIVAGELSTTLAYEDELVVAFSDIHPQAPTHLLIVPRRHVESVAQLEAADAQLVGALLIAARRIAEQRGLSSAGYRLVVNTGSQAGQTIPHLHVHFLAGRRFSGGVVPPAT